MWATQFKDSKQLTYVVLKYFSNLVCTVRITNMEGEDITLVEISQNVTNPFTTTCDL